MEIYKPGASSVRVNGVRYDADADGIIDLPDDKINSSLWQSGFVVAKGRRREKAGERVRLALASEMPVQAAVDLSLVTAWPEPAQAADDPADKTGVEETSVQAKKPRHK